MVDNVDHNVITLDGQDTFHGMGVIAISSSDSNDTQNRFKNGKKTTVC